MLTKKDPQKHFTLIFSGGGEEDDDEEEGKKNKVVVKKGKSLRDLLEPILETRGLSFETHSLFLDSSNTPLPLSGDTFHYLGTVLYVRENEKIDVDKRIISLMKSDSKKLSVSVTKRFSELLDQYGTISNEIEDDEPSEEFTLESCWQDIIIEHEEMSSRQKVQQEAIWELFTTEVRLIKHLQIIIDVFRKCFRTLQDGGYMTEVNETLIFANIGEVYNVNVTFWRRLKKSIDKARVSKQAIRPSHLLESFEGFEHLFQPYIKFCNADTSNMKLPDYSPCTNDMIKQYLTWCDLHEKCERITMAGFLIKPLQRVTKYSLLLKAILNKTDDEGEKVIAEDMMSRVETFVSKINNAVHLRQEQEKLNNVLVRLSDYCPVNPVTEEVEHILKDFCNLNFKGNIPGLSEDEKRFILKEGPMKLVEKQGKKEVYVFLFSDVFLITKLKRNIDKYRVHRPPYRLNKIRVYELKDPGQLLFVYLNEYGVVANAFVLQVNTDEREKWKTTFENAKSNYELIRTEFGLRQEFWDDDLPTSSISKNKVLRRHAAVTEKEPSKKISDSVITKELESHETVLIAAGIAIFISLNIIIARLMGLLN